MAIGGNLDRVPGSILSVCYSSNERSISRLMAEFLAQKDADESKKTLFYVDAMDRFPVAEFCELLPPQEHAALFENVRVLTSLDMDELSSTVGQISRSIFAARSTHHRSATSDHTTAVEPAPQALIVVRGFDVIFRNTALKDQQHAHRSLKDTMLRLRMLGNLDDFGARTILIFPPLQAPPLTHETKPGLQPPLQKRHKSGAPSFQNNNSVSAYVMKFYADSVIDVDT
ncbi:LAFA_0F20626g1_1 [Lachancea sp. 'fantastica']|nr:LAFA_0F20626g1_1 [Lachancea sp. 'fantastica']